VHSASFLTGKKKASLAPCALAGYPLALTVCGRRMGWVVTTGFAYRLLQLFPIHALVHPRQAMYCCSVACVRASAISSFISHLSSLFFVVQIEKRFDA